MKAKKAKQPAEGGVFTAEDYWFLGKTMALSYQHALRRRAAADDSEKVSPANKTAFAATPGSANVSGAPQQSGAGGEREERALDALIAMALHPDSELIQAKVEARLLREDLEKVEAENRLLKNELSLLSAEAFARLFPAAGVGEQRSDSEPSHSPSDPSSATRGGDR